MNSCDQAGYFFGWSLEGLCSWPVSLLSGKRVDRYLYGMPATIVVVMMG